MFFFFKIRCISVHDTYHQQIMPWPATVMFFACIQVEDLATNSVRPDGVVVVAANLAFTKQWPQ